MPRHRQDRTGALVPAWSLPRGTWMPAGSDILRHDPVTLGVVNGMVVRKWNARPPSDDYDLTRRMYRRYVNTGSQSVQLISGVPKMIRTGYRWPYRGAGWYSPGPPMAPGYQPTMAGFPPRGPDPWSMARRFVQGPGRNPVNPGGPATIAAPAYENPMTG